MKKNIKLSLVIEKINTPEWEVWFDENISVRNHLSMDEKRVISKVLVTYLAKQEAQNIKSWDMVIEYEISCLFNILLSYTNVAYEESDMSYENVDLMQRSGFVNKILDVCREDYDFMKSLIEKSIAYESIITTSMSIKNIVSNDVLGEFKTLLQTLVGAISLGNIIANRPDKAKTLGGGGNGKKNNAKTTTQGN